METSACSEEDPSSSHSSEGDNSSATAAVPGCGGQPWSPVKSTAIVKYSAITSPVHYARLKFNTDLNLPPSNWLKSSAESYGLHHTLDHHSSGFSSFRLTHMFPDCVGEVDVVSDAENIKKLLKIPYSRGSVSMMVHRIENTLLIDEFDIHKHLLRQAESDWEWLRKFFYEHVFQSLSEKDKALLSYRNNTRYALQQKSLVSKFLHYSLAEPEARREGTRKSSLPMPLATCGPALPEPGLEEGLPDCGRGHNFTRNVVWTFEDIQMLLGTDMPIFGGSTHPCISLRLRDVAKPISVLTGIDYWLDNMMSNVPEVVMCYHLDGIVQKYELVKTEDLPHLPDAKFSPKLIRDVAQNILSFLKSNATKAGHTYWLFKGRDDDVVKLYDLSSLCSDTLVDRGQNPFTVPVGMLLYRVARNMKQSYMPMRTGEGSGVSGGTASPGGPSESPSPTSSAGTIRMLLKNTLALLPKEKYPQIVISSHYMLSDLYVPFGTDPTSPKLQDERLPQVSGEETGEEEEDSEDATSNSVPVTDLCISTRHSQFDYKYCHPPPLVGSLEERCKMALQHVSEGLECLQYFDTPDANNAGKEEEPQMAKPFQAIPMPYGRINHEGSSSSEQQGKSGSLKTKEGRNRQRKKSEGRAHKKDNVDPEVAQPGSEEDNSLKALLCMNQGGDTAGMLPTWQQPNKMDNPSWKKHLASLLLAKARLVYSTLAEQHYLNNRFGLSLRYLSSVLSCCGGTFDNNVTSSNNIDLVSLMLSRAGDCCLRLVQDWNSVETHRADLAADDNLPAVGNQHSILELGLISDIPTEIESVEQVLLASLHCYQRAAMFHPTECLTRKLGNVHNELGSMYMNQAASMFQDSQECIENEQFQTLLKESEQRLSDSLKAFESVNDCANVALIHSNRGRLMRLRAHCSANKAAGSQNLTTQQRNFYNKAQNSYLAALSILKSRKSNPIIWDTVTWELSTSLFTIATLTQDYPSFSNKSQEEVEREVAELLLKALKYCDLDTPGPRLPVYQFRAAKIHHRLASLYHKSYREHTSGDDSRRRNLLQLCQMHYFKASRLLFLLEHPSDLLTVQIERVSLAEFICEMANSNTSKLKSLQNALDIIVECKPILLIMEERNKLLPAKMDNSSTGSAIDEMEMTEREEEDKLMALLEQRLQFILRTIIKLVLTGTNQKGCSGAGQNDKLVCQYKQAYSLLLKRPPRQHLVTHLINVVDLVNQH